MTETNPTIIKAESEEEVIELLKSEKVANSTVTKNGVNLVIKTADGEMVIVQGFFKGGDQNNELSSGEGQGQGQGQGLGQGEPISDSLIDSLIEQFQSSGNDGEQVVLDYHSSSYSQDYEYGSDVDSSDSNDDTLGASGSDGTGTTDSGSITTSTTEPDPQQDGEADTDGDIEGEGETDSGTESDPTTTTSSDPLIIPTDDPAPPPPPPPSNNAPTGAVNITGTVQEGQVLTADTATVADSDGLGAFAYQWQSSSDGGTTWTDIGGATASTYTLTGGDVGNVLRVGVSYTDGQGNAESLSSTATGAVANLNNAPTGAVNVTGTVTEDQVLTADTATIADADGLGAFSYQWQSSSDGGTTWGNIGGATASTYTLGDSDVGNVVRVQVSYTDGQGTLETLNSAQTAAVANINDTPGGAPAITGTVTEDQVLTADTASITDNDGLGAFSYQWQSSSDGGTTWGNIGGATASTYTLGDSDVGNVVRVQVSYTDGQGTLETLNSAQTAAVVNINDTPGGAPAITGTVTEDQILTADTTSITDNDGLGAFSYQWQSSSDGGTTWGNIGGATASTYTLGDSDVGNVVRVQVSYTDGQGTLETLNSAQTAAVANINDTPGGAPAITGTVTEDQVLTADTTSITDNDGLGAFSYQWQSSSDGGTTWGNIGGATASTYTLGDSDVGNVVRVQVSYTDGQGTLETLNSAQTAAVANINDTPGGAPAITGTVTEDQVLTADTASITDNDGLGAFSYQWQSSSDGGTTWGSIGGATASTYTLGDSDVGNVVRVQVSYTDGQGTLETLNSAQTAAVVNVNDAPILDLDGDNSSGAADPDYNATWNEGTPVNIADTDTVLSDVDNTTLQSMTITLTNAQDGTSEFLYLNGAATTAAAGAGLTVIGDNSATISITGSATLADYQTVLEGILWDNTLDAPNTTTRIVDVVINDGSDPSLTATTSITVNAIDDNDTLTGTPGIDTLIGDNGNDTIDALASDDTLIGSGGNDTLIGGAGNDTLNGGAGTDTADYSTSTTGVTVDLIAGTATGEGNDTIISVENVTGSAFADTLSGDANANSLSGGAGNDTLYGATGNDTLDGGAGTDTADYSASASGVTVNLGTGTATGSGNDTLIAIENITGSAFADTLTGDANANTLSGGAGNDTLTGAGGADTIIGGAGDDTITGDGADILDAGLGSDTLDYSIFGAGITVNLASDTSSAGDTITNFESVIGTANADTLIGDANANTLEGGAGNDVLDGGAGNDVLDGGAGTDTVGYSSATAGVTVDLNAGTATGEGNDTLISIENISGSAFNDDLTGDANANTLSGGAGDDTLYDWLFSNDILDGGAGTDTVDYSASTVNLAIDLGTGTASGNGSDTLISIENILAGSGDDTLVGDANANILNGASGNDTLTGDGADTLDGGTGVDTLDYSSFGAGVTVNLATNTSSAGDTITNFENVIATAFADTLTGDTNINILSGGTGDDTLFGSQDFGAGGDVSEDTLDGGAGTDTVSYANFTIGVTVDLLSGTATAFSQFDTLISIENITGTVQGDTLIGDANANTILAGDGDDSLYGGAGDDILDGGNGSDTWDFSSVTTAVTVNLATGVATGQGNDVLVSIENVAGGSGNDTITGDANNNILSGAGGNDTLDGGTGTDTADYSAATGAVTVDLGAGTAAGFGNDTLINIENVMGSASADTLTGDANANTLTGGAGNDIFNSSAGNDIIDGGAGTDTIDYSTSAGGITLSLLAGTATGSGSDSIISVENATGSAFADSLTGSAAANVINGGAGDDVIDGGSGIDTVNGGAGNDTLTGDGNDTLDGGLGTDTLDYSAFGAGVTVNLTTSTSSAGDTISNFENVTGSAFADTLIGDVNANNIQAGAGDDLIDGGTTAGSDVTGSVLDGGSGIDTIDYSANTIGLNVDLLSGIADASAVNTDVLINIENITSGSGSDTLTGDANNNTLISGAGSDTLIGGAGDDTLDGGLGLDTADYSSNTIGVTVNLSIGTATGEGNDTLVSIENLKGGLGNDNLTGDANANVLEGSAGNDSLDGGAGNDTIYGDAGNDTIIADAGDDNINGGAGIDTIDYSANTTGVTVDLVANTSVGAGSDTVFNIENITATAFADTLTGDANANSLSAGAGNDTINSSLGNDVIDGGLGTDTIDFSAATSAITANLTAGTSTGSGSDTLIGIENITGSANADTLTGDANANTISGGAGNDTLTGAGGADILNGDAGNDTLVGDGSDILDGGLGVDTLDYSSFGAGVTVDLGTGTSSAGDTITNLENVTGTAFADTLSGDANNNILSGNAGNDLITADAGDDTIDGGAGADTIDFSALTVGVTVNLLAGTSTGSGNDTIINVENVTGTTANDVLTGDGASNTLSGGDGDDILAGGLGDDMLSGGNGTDTADFSAATTSITANLSTGTSSGEGNDTIISIENLTGSAQNDTLTGDANANTINGGAGNDTLTGAGGADILNGEAGNDTLVGDGLDTLDGGLGIDTLDYSSFGSGVTVDLGTGTSSAGDTITNFENVTGTAFADTLSGDANANTLSAGAGNDTVTSSAGNDTLDGGAGTDTADYSAATAGVVVDLSAGTATGSGNDILVSFENVTGTAFADTISGDANNNTIIAGTGDDFLIGGAGDDILDGGAGSDTWDFSSATAGVTVDLAAGTATGQGNDTIISIENISGSAFADTLTGDANANVISGNAGNDTIVGSAGNDTFDGGLGSDTVDYSGSTSAVTVNLSTGTATGSGNDTLISIENIVGSALADTLTGDANANTISSGAGDDSITGSLGDDVIDGGAGTDTIDYSSATLSITVDLSSGTATGSGNDTLLNIENITGGAGNDTLTGDANANSISGGAGDDTISGGTGNDILDGGAGTDTVDYSSSAAAVTVNLTTGSASGSGSDTLINIEGTSGSAFADSLTGDANSNTLSGGAGNDLLYGKDGLDTLWGDGGADTFVFENASAFNNIDVVKDFDVSTDNDVLDISDILSANGYVDGVDTLTDWVQITDDGTDSFLWVDTTGTATFGAATQIATLEAITAITDEAALEASGNLVVV